MGIWGEEAAGAAAREKPSLGIWGEEAAGAPAREKPSSEREICRLNRRKKRKKKKNYNYEYVFSAVHESFKLQE